MGETTGTPEVRVGDRERHAVDDQLMAAVGDGVLTLHEYDERSALLWQARTRGELDQLVADLPGVPAQAPASAPVVSGGRPQRVVAVMSEDRFAGAVAPGQAVHGYALMGKAVLDLRRDDLPDGAHVQVRSVMGEVEVQVPAGSVVHLSGFAVMGERRVQVSAGDGPTVHVDAVAVMGSVRVTPGDGTVVARSRHFSHGGHTSHGGRAPAVRSSVPGTGSRAVAHTGGLRGLVRRGRAAVLPVAVLGAVLLAGPDTASIFGSSVERVTPDDRSVAVSTLFGSVTVVVPDGSQVDPRGVVVFGSTDCEQVCAATGDGPVVDVRSFGAFGSVEIVTASEHAADQREDADEERRERQDDD